MRVYIDARINQLYIEGVSSGPTTDFVVSQSGNNISIYRESLQEYEIYLVPYTALTDQQGNGFSDAYACVTYLTGLTVYQLPITAVYPLVLDAQTQNLSLDQSEVTDGGSY